MSTQEARTSGAHTSERRAPDDVARSPDSAGGQPGISSRDATRPTGRSLALIFAALIITMLMAALSQTVLATALPSIVGDLDGVEHMAWVITAFILASTVTMPVYGKLGDMFGRKPLFLFAISIFVLGSAIGGAAQSMEVLIAGRVVQGLGGGGLMILSQATIADVVPARERGRYMGVMVGVFAFASVAGPLLGGWLTDGPGWRWTLWMNLPLGVMALLGVALLLRLPPRERAAHGRIDVGGMMLLGLATAALVLVVTWGGGEMSWTSPMILSLIGVGLLASALFVWVEARAGEPVMPLRLLANRNFVLTTGAGLITGVGMFGVLSYMPTYLQMVTGYSPAEAGLLMIPLMGSLLITSITVGRRVSTTGRYKRFMVTGSVITAASLGLLSTLAVESSILLVCLYLGMLGLGLGSMMQLLTLVAQNSFGQGMVGVATAGHNYFRQVGATLGAAVVGSLFAARVTSLLTGRLDEGAVGSLDVGSLTPGLIAELPEPAYQVVVESYHEALIPLFFWMMPLVLGATVMLLFIKEHALSTTLDR